MIWGYAACFLAGGLSGIVVAAVVYAGAKETEDEERRNLERENKCLKIELELQRAVVAALGKEQGNETDSF